MAKIKHSVYMNIFPTIFQNRSKTCISCSRLPSIYLSYCHSQNYHAQVSLYTSFIDSGGTFCFGLARNVFVPVHEISLFITSVSSEGSDESAHMLRYSHTQNINVDKGWDRFFK